MPWLTAHSLPRIPRFMENPYMTFETLLAELRAGNVPKATQNEILLVLAEAIEELKNHRHIINADCDLSSDPV